MLPARSPVSRTLMVLSGLHLCLGAAWAQGTPPMTPQVQELELPPPIELGAPATIAPDLPRRPLTAEEAAIVALYYHPAVAIATAGVERARARLAEVQAGLRPDLNLAASVSGVAARGDSPGDQRQLSVALRQLLHDFGHTESLVSEAAAIERWAVASLLRVQLDVVARVKLAFYVYVQSTRLVGVAEANLRNQQEHLALARARLNSGLGLPLDVVRAETAFAEAVYALMVARNNALQARVSLAGEMGIDPRTPLEAAETDEEAPAADDVGRLVELALARRPELTAAAAEIEAQRYALLAARTENDPVLTGSVGLQHRGGAVGMHDDSISLGVSVAWNAWDSGAGAARLRQAEAELQAIQSARAALELSVTAEVSQAYLSLKSAEQRVAVAEAQLTNAREARRLAEGRYRAGLGVFLDVMDAQTAVDSAAVNRVNALSARDQSRVALAHAVGAHTLPAEEPRP